MTLEDRGYKFIHPNIHLDKYNIAVYEPDPAVWLCANVVVVEGK